MSKSELEDPELLFDLAAIDRELRQEGAYQREGHTARTLLRASDLRIVFIVLKGGSRIAEHHANESASVQTISGHLRLHLPDQIVEVPVGRLLVLGSGLKHDVEASIDSAFVLTLGWRA